MKDLIEFLPCNKNPLFYCARYERKDSVIFIFGFDSAENTARVKHQEIRIEKLASNIIINNADLKPGVYYFEFENDDFEFCDKKPEWSNYSFKGDKFLK